MSRGWRGTAMRLLGAKDHLVTVAEREHITSTYLRIRFEAPTIFEVLNPAPAEFLRFWFPGGEGDPQEYQRAYTVVDADPETESFCIEAVLHEAGPAGPGASWCASAQPGKPLVAQVLGSTAFALDPASAGLVLIGDMTALPAVNAIIGALPADRKVRLLLEYQHDEDLQVAITGHPLLEVHRTLRNGPESLASAFDLAALEDAVFSLQDCQVWAAGESGSLKLLRSQLRGRPGATKANTHIQAYWYHGRAMGNARR